MSAQAVLGQHTRLEDSSNLGDEVLKSVAQCKFLCPYHVSLILPFGTATWLQIHSPHCQIYALKARVCGYRSLTCHGHYLKRFYHDVCKSYNKCHVELI